MVVEPSTDLRRMGRLVLLVMGLLACPADGSLEGPPSAPSDEWQSSLLRDHPLVGNIIATDSGRRLSLDELIAELQQAEFALIGEKHDNPDHHRLEARLLERLVSPKRPAAVVFEMLDDQQRPHVSSLSGDLSLDQLRDLLRWPEEGRGWAWADYGPLFRAVLGRGGSLRVGNIDHARMGKIYKDGVDALQEQERMATVVGIDPVRREQMLELAFVSHCETMPRSTLGPMVEIQLARDASMASALRDASGPFALLIAGAVHVRGDLGVPVHLRLAGRDEFRILQLIEVETALENWREYEHASTEVAHYVWFTPKFTDRDYCDDLPAKPQPGWRVSWFSSLLVASLLVVAALGFLLARRWRRSRADSLKA